MAVKMNLSGWGRYPVESCEVYSPSTALEAINFSSLLPMIARGNGRSYGDSSLFKSIISTERLNHILDFDKQTGILECQAGITLREILKVIVPHGWTLPVLPGTGHVSVGGAIASDIHGKNHHLAGSFSDHLDSMVVLTGNGEYISTSRLTHTDLFLATCGGMGLTGLILTAKINLKRIYGSDVREERTRARNLTELFDLFEHHKECTYSVAWIDTIIGDNRIGRSILITGEHASTGQLSMPSNSALLTIPFEAPGRLLNKSTVSIFNNIYYQLSSIGKSIRLRHFESFFFPLDSIINWNYLYGKSGFLQYQFVVPVSEGKSAISKVLGEISQTGSPSFLSVLKKFGKGNLNYLSFPQEGYTLAMDIPVSPISLILISKLNSIVTEHGGRVYLCKDACLDETSFKSSYQKWQEFQSVREKYSAIGRFKSNQSIRLGLE